VLTTTLSLREFELGAAQAAKAAAKGPVFITDSGRPAHVLLTFSDYQKITRSSTKIADLLAMPGAEDLDFDTAPSREPARSASLT
jgi:PHD/YefM family antitoxin component YafN of YafNO toxin-antitoxin module